MLEHLEASEGSELGSGEGAENEGTGLGVPSRPEGRHGQGERIEEESVITRLEARSDSDSDTVDDGGVVSWEEGVRVGEGMNGSLTRNEAHGDGVWLIPFALFVSTTGDGVSLLADGVNAITLHPLTLGIEHAVTLLRESAAGAVHATVSVVPDAG